MSDVWTREVRLTDRQINYFSTLVRRRISDLEKKIVRAEENRAAGATIQHRTLDGHYTELKALLEGAETLQDARERMAAQAAEMIKGGRR